MADLKAEVNQVIVQKWCELVRTRDVEGIADLYSEDCKYLLQNSPIIDGRENVRKYYQDMFAGEVVPADAKAVIDEVGPAGGDFVFVRGVFEVFKADGSSLSKDKFMLILKRVNGKLSLYIDMDNSF